MKTRDPLTTMPSSKKWNRTIVGLILIVLIASVFAGVYVLLSSHDVAIGLSESLVVIQRGTTHTLRVYLVGKNTPGESASLSVLGLPSNVTAAFSNPNPQLVANGNSTSNMTITVGSHAYSQNSTLIVSVSAGGLTRQTSLLLSVVGNKLTYDMVGSYTGSWSIGVINATLGDTIILRLTTADVAHAFFVDYNGNTMPDMGEPLSPDFSSATVPTVFSFMVTFVGTFHYYCKYHPNMMGILYSAPP